MRAKSLRQIFGGSLEGEDTAEKAHAWLSLIFRTLVVKNRDSEILTRLVKKLDENTALSDWDRRDCARYLRLLAKEFYYVELEEELTEEVLMAIHYVAQLRILGPRRSKKAKHDVAASWGTSDSVVTRARTNNPGIESMVAKAESRYVDTVRVIQTDSTGGEVVERWTSDDFYREIVKSVEKERTARAFRPPKALNDAECAALIETFKLQSPADDSDREVMERGYRNEISKRREGVCPVCWNFNDEWTLVHRYFEHGATLVCPKSGCDFVMRRITGRSRP